MEQLKFLKVPSFQFSNMTKTRGLYIHIPFCPYTCYYCDFLAFPYQEKRMEAYVESLIGEIKLFNKKYGKTELDTIFYGGGTPSYLPVELLEEIHRAVFSNFTVDPASEISLELNPDDVTFEKAYKYKAMGLNRLSLGIQSFNDDFLKLMGRGHTGQQAVKSFEILRKAAFDNISLDLIFAIPGQSLEDFSKDLDLLVELDPEHLSLYSLYIEENTYFNRLFNEGKLVPVEDEVDRALYDLGIEKLNAYDHYEISNFAKAGYQCAHNLKYWHLDEYIGLGLGSSSYYMGQRHVNTDNLRTYSQLINQGSLPIDQSVDMDEKELKEDYIIMNMRLLDGIRRADYKTKFGRDFYADFKGLIDKHVEYANIVLGKENIYFTKKGRDLSDSFLREIL